MQDIGGCRVVLGSDSLEELRRLESLVCERWEVKDRDDYVSRPRESGYRAVHVIASSCRTTRACSPGLYIALERNEPPGSEDQQALDDLSSQIAALAEKEEGRGIQD
ncbi:hypothetical protein D4740_09445 [Actinomyces sp. 2119]|nr:RelA/SpoT domain-containing protein [Actinomyces sp. 2119]RJF41140.1 hypothetical protein D4740_09445 [Actinomyces sp. 2119]